jgi:hypothetical protein
MSVLIRSSGNIGPFKVIETLADRLRCDGTDYPFTVIGDYTISDDDSLAPTPPAPPTPVPEAVSPRQIRQALTQFGLRETIEASVAGGDQNAKDWWQYATVFERKHPMVLGMAQALGVTEKQLDDLWILAGTL